MILKKYLTEVSFINGSEEFKSYRNYTKTIIVDRNSNELSTIRIELNEKEGGRHQSFVVENADLVRAKVINELKVK